MIKTLIFDLDGTLIDTSNLVLQVFASTISKFSGHPQPDETVMRSTFGHPDDVIWRMLLPGASDAERTDAYRLSSQEIEQGMKTVDVLIPDARETLTELKRRGYTLTIASNCAIPYLNAVLDSQAIRTLFTRPLCLESVSGKVKAEILAEHFKVFNPAESVMIGDRKSDMEAAEVHGIPAIGCQFGTSFGHENELAGASKVVHALPELLGLFPTL